MRQESLDVAMMQAQCLYMTNVMFIYQSIRRLQELMRLKLTGVLNVLNVCQTHVRSNQYQDVSLSNFHHLHSDESPLIQADL